MDLLYRLTIGPLEIAYGIAYAGCSAVLGYGYGLLALSALTTALLAPLRKLVSASQDDERRLQAILAPQLARIRAEHRGEDRHRRIQRLYRRYGYHPLFAVKALWSLLLQIPFLCAAYYMLSALTDLRGVSFWGIADLGAPDRLLPWGVNLLPLLMTAFNIAAALLTPGNTRREKIQAIAVALLFLAMLYGAPAALLIYWTCNNLFILAVALQQRYRPAAPAAVDFVEPLRDEPPAPRTYGDARLRGYAALTLLALLGGYYLFERGFNTLETRLGFRGVSGGMFARLDLVLACAMLATAAWETWLYRRAPKPRGHRRTAAAFARIGACLLIAAAVLIGRTGSNLDKEDRAASVPAMASEQPEADAPAAAVAVAGDAAAGRADAAWMPTAYTLLYLAGAALALWGATATWRGAFAAMCVRSGAGAGLYGPAALVLGSLLAVFSPMALYRSSPSMFGVTPWELLRSLLPYLVGGFMMLVYLWVVIPRKKRIGAGLLLGYLALAAIVYTLVLPPRVNIDNGMLTLAASRKVGLEILFDFLGLALPAAALALCARFRALPKAAGFMAVAALAFTAYGGYVAAAGAPGTRVDAAGDPDAPPDYHRQLFALSRDQPNVLAVMFDMFTGGDLDRILAEDPDLARRLDGFTWYPDTMADAPWTIMSMPALFGGPDYTPEAMNARPERTLRDKVVDAMAELPRRFLAAGFDVALYDVWWSLGFDSGTPPNLRDRFPDVGPERLVDVRQPEVYGRMVQRRLAGHAPGAAPETENGETRDTPEIEDRAARYVLALSLFRATPNPCRATLYRAGFLGANVPIKQGARLVIPYMLPEFVNVSSPRPTFKIFVSQLSHTPWLLEADTLAFRLSDAQNRELVDGANEKHYHTDRHIVRMVADLVDRLKALGVYDNTRLVFASDHDDSDSLMLSNALGITVRGVVPGQLRDAFVRPHALLLVKDFGARGALARSPRLMQGHDLPALACAGIPGIPDPPPWPEDAPDRIRRHVNGNHMWSYHSEYRYRIDSSHTVKGTMFRRENWDHLPFQSKKAASQ